MLEKLSDALVNLLKIKSLVTIISTIVFAVLLLTDRAIPQEFMLIYTAIIAFYFGTQTMKATYDSETESKTSNLWTDSKDTGTGRTD